MTAMPADLDATSLTPGERRVVERATQRLQETLGDALHGVWLYGSRARGEPGHDESDVDLLVITHPPMPDRASITGVFWDAALAEGDRPAFFSVHVHDTDWLAQRRSIASFYIQEVDRDKVVLAGQP